MKPYEYLEHTADIGLRAYGKNAKEAFENAALGMFGLITDLDKVKEVISFEVSAEAGDREELLVEWLNELIYLFEAEGVLFKRFEIYDWDEEFYLKARVFGEKVDLNRHEIALQVKACTYHMLKVGGNDQWVAQVIFDV